MRMADGPRFQTGLARSPPCRRPCNFLFLIAELGPWGERCGARQERPGQYRSPRLASHCITAIVRAINFSFRLKLPSARIGTSAGSTPTTRRTLAAAYWLSRDDSGAGSPPSGDGSYPWHCSTGSRGYLGKLASVAERSHKKKIDPRSDSIRRLKRQPAQRPTRDWADSVVGSLTTYSITLVRPSPNILCRPRQSQSLLGNF
jgi:hypothetical protein